MTMTDDAVEAGEPGAARAMVEELAEAGVLDRVVKRAETELAILLGVPPRNMLTQLGAWVRLGFFTPTRFGTYRLNTPAPKPWTAARPLTTRHCSARTRLRRAVDPGASTDPAGLTARASPKARPETRAANLLSMPVGLTDPYG